MDKSDSLMKFLMKRLNHFISEFVCKYDSHCNNKGKCNKKTGKCECNPWWLSEDCTPKCKLALALEDYFIDCLLKFK